MSQNRFAGTKTMVGVAVVALLVAGGVAAWLERTPLLALWYVRCLTRATDADRDACADRVAGLGEAAVPGLLQCLTKADEGVCRNGQAGLERLAAQWGVEDARTTTLALRMTGEFTGLSPAGRCAVLHTATGWFRSPAPTPPPTLIAACGRLVAAAAPSSESEVHAAALELCGTALDRFEDSADMIAAGRELARACLRDEAPANRIRAVKLAVHPGLDAMDQVVALLGDPAPEVRRAAVLAVGPASDSVLEDSLLPCLHDSDAEVRRLCEEALRVNRHFSAEHLRVGWLLTHPEPSQRLNVLDYLRAGSDLEPGLWLRRLSHDPAPSVRLAAARVMSQQHRVDLGDRLDQMARSDPSPTVCQMARLYQKWARASAAAPVDR